MRGSQIKSTLYTFGDVDNSGPPLKLMPCFQITMISATDSKPRGYAFIEYEHERDMHCKWTAGIYVHACNYRYA